MNINDVMLSSKFPRIHEMSAGSALVLRPHNKTTKGVVLNIVVCLFDLGATFDGVA